MAVCALIGAVATILVAWTAAITRSDQRDRWTLLADLRRYQPLDIPPEHRGCFQRFSSAEIEASARMHKGLGAAHLWVVLDVSSASIISRISDSGSPMEWMSGWRYARIGCHERWGADLAEAVIAASSDANIVGVRINRHAARYGWPLHAMWVETEDETRTHSMPSDVVYPAPFPTVTRPTRSNGLGPIPFGRKSFKGTWDASTDLPLLPLINGFMADSLLFGGVAWILLFGAPPAPSAGHFVGERVVARIAATTFVRPAGDFPNVDGWRAADDARAPPRAIA